MPGGVPFKKSPAGPPGVRIAIPETETDPVLRST